MSCARPFPRLLAGPAALLALGIVLIGSAPAPAADLTNPAGNTITSHNPGLEATADGERLTNLGGIEVTSSTSDAYGMGDPSGSFSGLILSNSGSITVNATTRNAETYGLFADHSASLSNSGSITVNATATNNGEAYGLYADHSASLRNSGSISVNASATDSGYAYGLYADQSASLSNSGSISVNATGGSYANAYGLYADHSASLSNSGSISVNATGGSGNTTEAYGLYGADTQVSLLNSGSITVSATGGDDAFAYGLKLASGTAANYGVVTVHAQGIGDLRAHELTAYSGTSGTVKVTAWALGLRDFSDPATRPFGVDGRTWLDFDGSSLILRPSDDPGFALNREYAVKDMVAVHDPNGSFSGTVARALAEMPLLEARLSGTDVSNQTVSLRAHVTPRTNPGQNAVVQGLDTARGQVDIVGTALAWQATPTPQAGKTGPSADLVTGGAPGGRWEFFGLPYYSHTSNNEPDYTASSVGLLLGGTYHFNERFAAGLHAGFSGGKADGELMNLDNTAQSWLAGAHAVCNVTPEWYVRGQFSGFGSEYDQSYRSGLEQNPLSADADYNGHGLYAALNTGYAWRINENNTLTPEIGLSWLWSHQDSFSLDWGYAAGYNAPWYNMDFDAQDYQSVDGTAMLRWRGNFALGSERAGSLRPTLGLGVRQRLNDEDVESSLRFAGSSFSTRVSEDRTTALAEAGLEWRMGGFALGLAYTGAYGDSRKTHGGWLNLRCAF